MYNTDGSFAQTGSSAVELFEGCEGKSIGDIYDEGRAFNFLPTKPDTIDFAKYDMPD